MFWIMRAVLIDSPVAMVAKELFHNIWTLFLSVEIPRLGVSFAAFAIALFLIRFPSVSRVT